jgi:hypothetical protein
MILTTVEKSGPKLSTDDNVPQLVTTRAPCPTITKATTPPPTLSRTSESITFQSRTNL